MAQKEIIFKEEFGNLPMVSVTLNEVYHLQPVSLLYQDDKLFISLERFLENRTEVKINNIDCPNNFIDIVIDGELTIKQQNRIT